MPGIIVGYFGFQRSGKTLKAFLDAESYRKSGMQVYSNMDVPGWNKIAALTDIPFNTEPKVLILDECYYFMDSRNWKNNTESTIFFNTIGKQNILLLLTAISPDMIEMRLRNQMNYVFLVKSDINYIYYKIIDVVRNKTNVVTVAKSKELFSQLTYDTNQVPDFVDCSLKDFRSKVDEYYNKTNKKLRSVKSL